MPRNAPVFIYLLDDEKDVSFDRSEKTLFVSEPILDIVKARVDPLSPNSDKHLISPYIITT